MRKFCFVGMIMLLSTLCTKESFFTIEGTVKNPPRETIYLMSADSLRAFPVVDAALLDDSGRFVFKHTDHRINWYKIGIGKYSFDIMVKNGDHITFETDMGDTTHNYQIRGSYDAEKIKEFHDKIWRKRNKATLVFDSTYRKRPSVIAMEADIARVPIRKRQEPEWSKKIEELRYNYWSAYRAMLIPYEQQVLRFIDDHKKSLVGFYAATFLDKHTYEKELVAYAETIRNCFPGNALVSKFIKDMLALKSVSIGQQVPDFLITDKAGKEFRLSDYKGKYVLLDFWASWCGPCRLENPNLVELYQIFRGKGLHVIGISLDDDDYAWEQAIKADQLTWRHASDKQAWDSPIVRQYKVRTIPANFLIDPYGKILAKNVFGKQLKDILCSIFGKIY